MTQQSIGMRAPLPLALAGGQVSDSAGQRIFRDYALELADSTRRRQRSDLALFSRYLVGLGLRTGSLARDHRAWRGITWAMVSGFARWQLERGYALGSVNVRLSTLRAYSALAVRAGTMKPEEYAMVLAIKGYGANERASTDAARRESGVDTRLGAKKSGPTRLSAMQAAELKFQPATPQGRRDAVMMALLLDHGLRVSELAALQVTNLDINAGELRFFRHSIGRLHVQQLTFDTMKAALAYVYLDAPALGNLLRASLKDGNLQHVGMTARGISGRVRSLGEAVGVKGLSAQDCRHHWALQSARSGLSLEEMRELGGWKTPATPLRFLQLVSQPEETAWQQGPQDISQDAAERLVRAVG